MATLSVILIVKNEADVVKRCLESVKFADEIIILDSGSSDQTVEICRGYTEKVFETDWPGFGKQRERAYELATQDWVLWIDADEWLSEALQTEIKTLLQNSPAADGYYLRRDLVFNGKHIRYAGGRDWVLRLCRRDKGKIDPLPIHEKLIVTGKLSKLKEICWHESYRDVSDLIERTNRYSTLGAAQRKSLHKTSTFSSALGHGFWTFIRMYLLRGGFLDGKEGFILSFSFAEGCYYRYLKASL